MTEAELRARLLAILGAIAPEARDTDLDPVAPLRDQIDIDSMDFLNFVTAVHKQLGVPIPELDYPRLSSLDGAVHYVMAKLGK